MKHLWIIVVGIVLIAIGQLIEQVIPLLGRAAFQAAAAGSYSPSDYEVNLRVFNLLSVLVIAIGIYASLSDRRREPSLKELHESSLRSRRTQTRGAERTSSGSAGSDLGPS